MRKAIARRREWKSAGVFLSLFAFAVFFVYFTGQEIARVAFLGLLPLYWRSRRDYVWFAFVFFVLGTPGGLFSGGAAMADDRLPLYTLAAGVSITFAEVFIATAFIKALIKGERNSLVFKRPLLFLGIYGVLLYAMSVILGMSPESHIQTWRFLFPLSMLLSVPALMPSRSDYVGFFRVLFPSVFVAFGSQLVFLASGKEVAAMLSGTSAALTSNPWAETEFAARILYAPFVLYLCFLGALFFWSSGDRAFSRAYLQVVISVALFSIFLSATRGWILSCVIVFGSVVLLRSPHPAKLGVRLLVPALILIAFYQYSPALRAQVEKVVARVATLELLLEGDLTAGGTLSRLTDRSAPVMRKFYQSPFTGFGFSDEAYRYLDAHVGNQSLLMSTGIIGFILFGWFWFKFASVTLSVRRRLSSLNMYRGALIVPAVGLVGIAVIHSTSTQLFGYIVEYSQPSKIMFLVLFIGFTDALLKEAVQTESWDVRRKALQRSRA